MCTHGYDVELALEKAIQTGQSVLLDYTDPDENVDDQFAIQSWDGTDAASLIGESVTNESAVAAPVFNPPAQARMAEDHSEYDQELSDYNADGRIQHKAMAIA